MSVIEKPVGRTVVVEGNAHAFQTGIDCKWPVVGADGHIVAVGGITVCKNKDPGGILGTGDPFQNEKPLFRVGGAAGIRIVVVSVTVPSDSLIVPVDPPGVRGTEDTFGDRF